LEGLRSQRVELLGRSETLVPGLDHHLFFLEHVHEFDPRERPLGSLKGLEPQHGTGDPLDCSMVLLHDIVSIFDLTDFHGRAMCLVVALDGRIIRVTAVNGDHLGEAIAADGFLQKPKRRLCIPVLCEQKIDGLAVCVDRTIQIPPLAFDTNVCLVQAPA
jgi:hypothetical protein